MIDSPRYHIGAKKSTFSGFLSLQNDNRLVTQTSQSGARFCAKLFCVTKLKLRSEPDTALSTNLKRAERAVDSAVDFDRDEKLWARLFCEAMDVLMFLATGRAQTSLARLHPKTTAILDLSREEEGRVRDFALSLGDTVLGNEVYTPPRMQEEGF